MTKKLLILLFCLSGCATYSSKFACAESKGAYCTPLHKVEEMIATGEVETLDIDIKKQKRCRLCK
jgi:hypothetical protein